MSDYQQKRRLSIETVRSRRRIRYKGVAVAPEIVTLTGWLFVLFVLGALVDWLWGALAERLPSKQNVAGSSPVSRSTHNIVPARQTPRPPVARANYPSACAPQPSRNTVHAQQHYLMQGLCFIAFRRPQPT